MQWPCRTFFKCLLRYLKRVQSLGNSSCISEGKSLHNMAIFYYNCTTRETLIWLENVKSHICNFLSASLILLVLSNLTTNPLNDITKIPQNYTYFPFLLFLREFKIFVIAQFGHLTWARSISLALSSMALSWVSRERISWCLCSPSLTRWPHCSSEVATFDLRLSISASASRNASARVNFSACNKKTIKNYTQHSLIDDFRNGMYLQELV